MRVGEDREGLNSTWLNSSERSMRVQSSFTRETNEMQTLKSAKLINDLSCEINAVIYMQ